MTERTPEEIAAQARSSFSILERAKGRSLVTDKVTVYMDEVAGKKLGGSRPRTRVIRGIEIDDGEHRWGVLGQIANLRETNKEGEKDAEIDALLTKAEAYKAELDASKYVIELQALPGLILEDAANHARDHVGVDREADVPEDKLKAYNRRNSAEMISRAVIGITGPNGEKGELPTPDDAAEWPLHFPKSEFFKITSKIGELQFETAIAEQATDNADF